MFLVTLYEKFELGYLIRQTIKNIAPNSLKIFLDSYNFNSNHENKALNEPKTFLSTSVFIVSWFMVNSC